MSWEDDAKCLQVTAQEPEMATAWDNVDMGDHYAPSPLENVAKKVCFSCPVRDMCFWDAVDDPEHAEGMRAGYRFHQGRVNSSDALKIQREYGVKLKLVRSTSNGSNSEV